MAACSTVSHHAEKGNVYVGRNYDWSHDPCLIVQVHGKGGPSSVAVLDPYYLQLDQTKLENLHFFDRLRLLVAPYLAFDGMNESGVVVSMMAANESTATFDPGKPTVFKPLLQRIILDYAHNTDEAVALVRRFNIDFDGLPSHFMFVDAAGKSAVVEFVEGRIEVVHAPRQWQVSTNHLLYGKTDAENCERCIRFRTASDRLAQPNLEMDSTKMMQIMSSISKPDWTMWTSVYNATTGEFQVAYRRNYNDLYSGRLDMRSRNGSP
jgi:penicillin V acylase-like amidase (Ntn superfamily)